jgi:hypothetical protein
MVVHDLKHPVETVLNQVEKQQNKILESKAKILELGHAVKALYSGQNHQFSNYAR